MTYLVFFMLCLVYLFLGIASVLKFKYNNLALKLFFVLTILAPFGKLTTKFHTNWQVSSYYLFFIGCFLVFLLKVFSKHTFKKTTVTTIGITLATVLGLGVHYIFIGDKNVEITNVLKDVKPYLTILLAIPFLEVYKSRLAEILTRKFINKILLINLFITSVFFFLMLQFNLHLLLTDDPYFQFEEVRLETLGIFFGGFYLFYLLIKNEKPTLKEILISSIPLLYTGNRTMIFAFILVLLLIYVSKLTLRKIFLILSSGIVGVISVGYLVVTANENSPFFRIKKLFDDGYISESFATRFSPFINAISDFSSLNFILGKGLGLTFYIDWFVWRTEINNYNVYLDSLYLTLYAKYGVFSILFFVIFYLYLNSYRNIKTSNYYFLLFILIAITNSFCYQFNFLWFLLIIAAPYDLSKSST
tara:strand:- start:37176 stop:38426 length:1251 start_codon:yes stop_codon:yes gene_type:complete